MNKRHIKFNAPYLSKLSKKNIFKVLANNKFADGEFQKKCEIFIERKIKSKCVQLTQSCTSALETSMILCNIKKGDEVIIPSFTFTSTANCLLLRGAKPIFVDINSRDLNIDVAKAEKKINNKTKAIIVVHYAGIACDMDKFLRLKKKYNLFLIEDAAHAFLGKYKDKYLGTIGDFGAFSFHETKNIVGGQGGAISINNKRFIKPTNIILDKGTDRSMLSTKKFYSWKGLGSEIRATELTSALIYSQLKISKKIQKKRKDIWNFYYNQISNIEKKDFYILEKNNKIKQSAYHVFPIVFKNHFIKTKFINYMKSNNIDCYFHYYPLHMSTFGKKFIKKKLKITEKVYNGLVRLPLYPGLSKKNQQKIISKTLSFLNN